MEFVQDGTRNEEIRDERQKYSDKIKEIYDKAGIKYTVIDGNYHMQDLGYEFCGLRNEEKTYLV